MREASPPPDLLVIGCGFVGREVADQARAEGRAVLVTTRDARRMAPLRAAGLEVHRLDGPDALDGLAQRSRGVPCVITYPPDPATDERVAGLVQAASAAVYISSTAVYGDTHGHIDDATPTAPNSERGRRRIESEGLMRAAGAVVLRAPGIYGRDRGVHLRLRAGTFRLVGDGSAHISRIHVADLAGLALAALARGTPGAAHVVGDLAPSSQRELVAFLCEQMGLPMPGSVAREAVHETLRGNRQVDPRPALAALGYALRFNGYREGYADALRACGLAPTPVR